MTRGLRQERAPLITESYNCYTDQDELLERLQQRKSTPATQQMAQQVEYGQYIDVIGDETSKYFNSKI